MSTANVTVSKSGTGFTIDVTDCDLLTDLSVKDFQVFHDGSLVSNTNYTKTSSTLLTYTGTSLGTTSIEVRRKTPNTTQTVDFASRFSSTLWNDELDKITRWREEADLNGVGDISLDTSFSPNNTAYDQATWAADSVQGATRQAIGNELESIRTDFAAADALDAQLAADNTFTGDNTFQGSDTFEAALSITDTTESTSKTTGALKVSGGIGASKDINCAGISFDNNANTLDTFVEGTFTPTFTASGSNPSISYGIQLGVYVRIGDVVFGSIRLRTESVSGGSGNVRVSGLPYTVRNTASSVSGGGIGYRANWASNQPTGWFAIGNTTYMRLYYNGSSQTQVSDMGTGSNGNDTVINFYYFI